MTWVKYSQCYIIGLIACLFLGGCVPGQGATNTACVYDAGSWRSLPTMLHARQHLGVATDGEAVYAVGGLDAACNE